MKVTASELAKDSNTILDTVVERGEAAEIQRDGKAVAEIRRTVGVDRRALVELLKGIKFTKAEYGELKRAMDAASEVIGYAGRD